MIRQYKRGWKCDKEMNKILKLVDFIIKQCPLNILQQIEIFKETTKKSRSSFFRYKRFLKNGTYYKKGMKGILKQHKKDHLNQILKEAWNIKRDVKKFKIVAFSLKKWMRETGRSSSSFFRLKRELNKE